MDLRAAANVGDTPKNAHRPKDRMPTIRRLLAATAAALTWVCASAGAQPASQASLYSRLALLAPSGNPEVQYHLGMFLNNGIGTAPDRAAAFKQFSQAAQAGHTLAAYKVGCYHAGQFPGVVPTDAALALQFKLRAAEAGYELAQLDVGTLFARRGEAGQAARWWESASRQGNLEATARLAHALSGDAAHAAKAYALMGLLKTMSPAAPKALLTRIDELQAQLTDQDKAAAAEISASWLQAKTPLTLQANDGAAAVPALLASLERRP